MDGKQHVDAGLVNPSQASHVCAALQALIHQPNVMSAIHEDTEHRLECRSMLKCMPCALHRLFSAMSKENVGNPVFFINLWRGISTRMDELRQKDAFEVFSVFMSKLRYQLANRGSRFNYEMYEMCPIITCFQGKVIEKVDCNLCGIQFDAKSFTSVQLCTEISELELAKNFLEQESRLCTMCKKFDVTTETESLELPQKLIVNSTKPCSSTFTVPLEVKVFTVEMEFKSCIAQDGDKVFFISLCPDGSVRKFQDEKISSVSLGKLYTSSLFNNCLLTVIYERRKASSKEKYQTVNTQSSKLQPAKPQPPKPQEKWKHKVIGFPNIECDMYSNLPEPPKSRTIDTQTESPRKVDVATQTDWGPLVAFETCRDHEKFEFFTGLCRGDFEAFHDFLGGKEAIRHLKLNYNPSTPVKTLPSRVSSHDRLLMFLLRLRRGLPLEELAFIFNISVSYAGELCYAMTRLIFETFKAMEDQVFVSALEQAKKMPKVMKSFKNLRVILDGVSIFIEMPTNFQMQGNTFSKYKSHNVMIFIIGVSCHGSTIFCSSGFEGNMSDKEALLSSPELLKKLQRGDSIMVDRGFDVTAELLRMGVHVIKPPLTGDSGHLNESQELLTKAIAAARIYVEHAIADVKDNRLLQGSIPLTLLPVLPQLVFIAAFMRNFSSKKIGNRTVRVE